jgi:hypothetical protein
MIAGDPGDTGISSAALEDVNHVTIAAGHSNNPGVAPLPASRRGHRAALVLGLSVGITAESRGGAMRPVAAAGRGER